MDRIIAAARLHPTLMLVALLMAMPAVAMAQVPEEIGADDQRISDAGIDGAAVVAGQITGGSVVTGAGVDLDAHTHVETGGTTQPPAPTGTAGTGPDEPDAPSEPVGGRPVLPDPPPGGYIP